MATLNTEEELRMAVNQITQSNLGPLVLGDFGDTQSLYHLSFLVYFEIEETIEECCETLTEYASTILTVVTNNSTAITDIQSTLAAMLKLLEYVSGDVEDLRKQSRYAEDRNLRQVNQRLKRGREHLRAEPEDEEE